MSEALSEEQLSYIIRHDCFQAIIVEALMVGIYTSIIFFTLHKLVTKRGAMAVFQPLIALMLLMYTCALMHLGRRWRTAKQAFIDHGQSEESTFQAFIEETTAAVVILHLSRGLIMFLADCIMIWRCWILYSQSWLVIALPLLLLLGEFGTLIGRIVAYVNDRSVAIATEATVKLVLSQLSFTLATTVLVTIMIIYRILRMGGFKRYRSIIEIIIESSALYAVTIIVYMPFPLSTTLFDIIPDAILAPMPGIASTLIIARVALGQGIEKTFDESGIATQDQARHVVSALQFRGTVTAAEDEERSVGLSASTALDSDAQRSRAEEMREKL